MQLHHVAYLTKNIDRKAEEFCRLLGLTRCSEPVVDPGQGVRIVFLDLGGTQLELIEPAGPDSPVANRVAKSPGLFHLCFEVDDLEETLRRLESAGQATVIKPPQPAPAIDDRRVAFVVKGQRSHRIRGTPTGRNRMIEEKTRVAWRQRWDGFCRKHPFLFWAMVLAMAFLTGPLMIAANHMTAVLYKDF